MKFTTLLLTTLAALSSATNTSNLRASASLDRKHGKNKNKNVPPGDAGFMGATISVSHVSGDKTNFDEDKVSSLFKDSYNTAHTNGYTIETAFIDKEIDIPEEDAIGETNLGGSYYTGSLYYFSVSFNCRMCHPDDDAVALTALRPGASKDTAAERRQFEQTFMDSLRDSDMAAFADINDVRIDFSYLEPTADDTAAEAALTEQAGKRGRGKNKEAEVVEGMHGQIEINHVIMKQGTTDEDMKALGKAYMEAYNEVYERQGLEATSFSLDREVDIPEDTDTPEGLLGSSYYFGSLYYFSTSYHCRMCHPDDDSMMLGSQASALVADQDSGAHLFFEKLFCHKIKKSGLVEYSEINHCAIAYEGAAADSAALATE